MPLAVMFLLSPKPSKRNFIVLLCLCILLTLQYVDRADDTLPVIRTYVIISSNLIFYLAIAMFYRAEVLRRSGRAKA